MSDHFDGERFYDPEPSGRTLGDLLRWQLHRHRGPWTAWAPNPPHLPPPRMVGPGELHVTFVNHSTVLIQLDGLNVLTDPVWSERVGPFHDTLGEARHRPPGIPFEELPPLDAVIVSHDHYDHLDLPTLERLAREHHPRFYVPLGNAELLAGSGIRATEMDWWEEVPLGHEVRLTCVPARHDSGRGWSDQNRSLWAGFLLRTPEGSVYFAGDTGYGTHFARIAARAPDLRLALLPIGSYEPRWFMAPIHLNPADAVQAFLDLRVPLALGIHYHTFRQTDEGEEAPAADLGAALRQAGISADRFLTLANGQGIDVPPLER